MDINNIPFSFTELILLAILLMQLILTVVFLWRTSKRAGEGLGDAISENIADIIEKDQAELLYQTEKRISDRVSADLAAVRQDVGRVLTHSSEESRRDRSEISAMLAKGQDRIVQSQDKMEQSLVEAVRSMQETNREKLARMQEDINKKLDMSLNERLDRSFKNVGDQLNRLYESLGELSRLETGVNTLNRTLSNVKSRGIYGEEQLENILSDILAPNLYDKNVVTKKSKEANRDAVEFAVRIPDKESAGAFMYLPVDSKFPSLIFEKILEASDRADAAGLKEAVKELEQRVKSDARDIQNKYIDPPNTTDFAVMFLPTESLYAEVLRIPGLVEECRSKYHIVITGPATVAALLNSLSIGFRYMAVNRDSQQILKLLGAIKTQYSKLSELIATAGRRIELARQATDDLKQRTDMINNRLSAVEEMDPEEAAALLKGDVLH